MKKPILLLRITAKLAASILIVTIAAAQDRPLPPTKDIPETELGRGNCSSAIEPSERSRTEGRGQAEQGQGSENLSDKLSKSEGVICPPRGLDPEIAMPPPGGGATPVIPPPGSPGGDPSVRPK